MAHRGSYKTTAICVVGLIIHILINPNDRILILRKEYSDNIKPLFREIGSQLNKPLVQHIAEMLWGEQLVVDATDSRIDLNIKSIVTREGNVEGGAIGQSLTGRHYTRIITDDIVTAKDRTSKAERERTKWVFQELQNIINPGCPICNVGTPWHREDAFELMPRAIKFPIGMTDLKAFTKKHITALKGAMTASLFTANYELRHVAEGDDLLSKPKYAPLAEGGRVAHLDCAYGGGNTTALTIGCEHDGDTYLKGFLWKESIESLIDKVCSILDVHDVGTLHLESNADKGLIAKKFVERKRPVKSYHERLNKHIKICNFLAVGYDRVFFDEETNPEYMMQCLEYREGQEPDDAPDSASSLCRVFKNKMDFSNMPMTTKRK